jgi:transcriptional regulator with XRE-family HTH domain
MRRFGEIVRSERLARGLTLEALAEKTWTHKGYISGIENGVVNPPAVGLVKRIARALKIKPFDLLIVSTTEKLPKEVRSFVQKAVIRKLG